MNNILSNGYSLPKTGIQKAGPLRIRPTLNGGMNGPGDYFSL